MIFYNLGFGVPPDENAFGGFADGYTQIPGGVMYPPNASLLGPGHPHLIGAELPSVDPYNYPGIIHFGPSYTIIGPHLPRLPPGAGVFDPNLVVPGVPGFYFGF